MAVYFDFEEGNSDCVALLRCPSHNQTHFHLKKEEKILKFGTIEGKGVVYEESTVFYSN